MVPGPQKLSVGAHPLSQARHLRRYPDVNSLAAGEMTSGFFRPPNAYKPTRGKVWSFLAGKYQEMSGYNAMFLWELLRMKEDQVH